MLTYIMNLQKSSEEINELTARYGTVPPPWAIYNEHPESICWRMGGGEFYIQFWTDWWTEQNFTEAQKIAYFRKNMPPFCWLAFLIESIWEVDSIEDEDALLPYFHQTSELGFGSREDYERDMDDPKWLDKD